MEKKLVEELNILMSGPIQTSQGYEAGQENYVLDYLPESISRPFILTDSAPA